MTGISALQSPTPGQTEKKTIGAAKDFEALLIGQMLKSIREEKSGWLSSGDEDSTDDSTNDMALSLGEQQIAQALAASGGLGLAKSIEQNLLQQTAIKR